jgi:hypothetical protein
MFEFAQFVALTSTPGFQLPDFADPSGTFVNTRTLPRFDLPGLNTDRTVVLQFRLSGLRGAAERMWMRLNEAENVVDYDLSSNSEDSFRLPRSWHHVVRGDYFQESGNVLTVGLEAIFGFISISDIIVIYHASIEAGPVQLPADPDV